MEEKEAWHVFGRNSMGGIQILPHAPSGEYKKVGSQQYNERWLLKRLGCRTRAWAHTQDRAEIWGICSKNAHSSLGREENTAKNMNQKNKSFPIPEVWWQLSSGAKDSFIEASKHLQGPAWWTRSPGPRPWPFLVTGTSLGERGRKATLGEQQNWKSIQISMQRLGNRHLRCLDKL